MRLLLPIPVKYALPCPERFEPSIIKMPWLLKPQRSSNPEIRVFNAPSSIGVNLLNNGAINVGNNQLINNEKLIKIAHAHTHQYSPTLSITQSTSARIGKPITAARVNCMISSLKNCAGVLLLKPNFSSMTNVPYQLTGISKSDIKSVNNAMALTPAINGEAICAAQNSNTALIPPKIVSPKINTTPRPRSISPSFDFASV